MYDKESPARALQRALVARFARMAACQPCLPQRTYPGASSLPGGRPRARATRVSPRATPDDAVILLASPPRGEEQEEESLGAFAFATSWMRSSARERDAHSDLNPSGACDLTRAESRLLEGKESARGWALGGIERAAPTTGAELKAEAARVLVDAGFGTPLTEGWLDPGWLTVLSTNAEAAAVEHVVEACVETFRVETTSDESSSSSDGARAATTPAATKIKPPASSSSRRIDRRFSGHKPVIIPSRWSRRTRRRSAGTSRKRWTPPKRRCEQNAARRRASRRLFSETPRPPPAFSRRRERSRTRTRGATPGIRATRSRTRRALWRRMRLFCLFCRKKTTRTTFTTATPPFATSATASPGGAPPGSRVARACGRRRRARGGTRSRRSAPRAARDEERRRVF